MKTWKTKAFGASSFNFYGGLFGGLLIVLGSLYLMMRGLDALEELTSTAAFLSGIYCVMLGCFGILLQNYLAQVAEKLDASQSDGRNG